MELKTRGFDWASIEIHKKITAKLECFSIAGDNWYTPDALDLLPSNKDVVLMNFYSRYSVRNAEAYYTRVLHTFGWMCTRLNDVQCVYSSLRLGGVDLGAMVIDLNSYAKLNTSFAKNFLLEKEVDKNCLGCHDGYM